MTSADIEPAQPCRCGGPIEEDFADQTAPSSHPPFIGGAIGEQSCGVTHGSFLLVAPDNPNSSDPPEQSNYWWVPAFSQLRRDWPEAAVRCDARRVFTQPRPKGDIDRSWIMLLGNILADWLGFAPTRRSLPLPLTTPFGHTALSTDSVQYCQV
jgi:hypothetical protein